MTSLNSNDYNKKSRYDMKEKESSESTTLTCFINSVVLFSGIWFSQSTWKPGLAITNGWLLKLIDTTIAITDG